VPEPLLHVEDLRVDVDGVPACDGLTARTTGDRVVVLGAPRALYEATCGRRPVVRGRLQVRGSAAAEAVREGIIAGAPLDPPLPAKWTPLDYVTWSARLSGHTANDAKTFAKEAIALVQLGALATSTMDRMVPHARRGVVLAAAIATGAAVIAVEDPLATLPEEVARSWARIVVSALADRSWMVFAARISLTSPLAMNADEALMVKGRRPRSRSSIGATWLASTAHVPSRSSARVCRSAEPVSRCRAPRSSSISGPR
jgi:ABC-type cobalamin/Fe3+-siderophores transport system ATPase subunit